MGNYNPHAPYIIGQEWVPVRDARYQPDTVTERGYTWYHYNSVAPVSGAYYVAETPDAPVSQVCDFMSVYPAGTEDQTGPIKVLHIPVSGISATGNVDVSQGFTALNDIADGTRLRFTQPGSGQIAASFDVAGYSQQLFGKRILDVRIRYAMTAFVQSELDTMSVALAFARDSNNLSVTYAIGAGPLTLQGGSLVPQLAVASVGDLNPFWDATSNPFTLRDIFPWRYQELSRLTTTETPGSRMVALFQAGTLDPNNLGVFFYFCDLEVVYCEEKRVLYGGRRTADNNGPLSPGGEGNNYYAVGAQFVRLRDPSFNVGTTLTPGRYTTTLIHDYTTQAYGGGNRQPTVHALRELYQLQHQNGIVVNQSLEEDATFTVEASPVLTHLTLHSTSSIVTGSHAYGTQVEVPIYGAINAIQEIEDDPVGAAALFPQVRFYARRFGDTTVPLRIIDVATGLSAAQITVAEFDALPEIVDGWKEVTLRLVAAPTFATAAGDVDWRFDAVGETAGNQWQVLGADGPSSAAVGHVTSVATYFAPIGDTVTLTWQSPPISGTANDVLSDAVLIFSQDPLPVSGFALSTASQVITGIALNCGTPPGCVPTGIGYVQLNWTMQTVLPVTGFGAYELERMDAVDGVWQQVMNATSPAVTGFSDFEARVGQTSWYRIRTCNVLDFCGPWVTGSATLPSPGVAVRGDGNSVLIFTSNKLPGSNLAYVMQWEGQPIETFLFPEASFVQLQEIFGKDFFTAFYPLERGGEQFSRSILVNAAAVPVPSLGNFRRLRDLGWASLPYVCVRDELGNRWYSNVRVPDGNVRQNRTVYIAQIQVAEVTATPFPVDPAGS